MLEISKKPFRMKERRTEGNLQLGFIRQDGADLRHKGIYSCTTPKYKDRNLMFKSTYNHETINPRIESAIKTVLGRWVGVRAENIFDIGYAVKGENNRTLPNLIVVQTEVYGRYYYHTFDKTKPIPEGVKTAIRLLERNSSA